MPLLSNRVAELRVNNAAVPFAEGNAWALGCKAVNAAQSGVSVPYPKVEQIRSGRNWDGARLIWPYH